MGIAKINNIFSPEELDLIINITPTDEDMIDENLGRILLYSVISSLTKEMKNKLYAIVSNISDVPLMIDHALCVEYSSKYGKPNLPPHFDGDTNNLIVNMQISSNISWDLGINLETYKLEDNSAIIFNANTEIHWRVHKEFQEGEYVRMLFVRFYDPQNRPDYSYLPNNQIHEVFKEARELRDNLQKISG